MYTYENDPEWNDDLDESEESVAAGLGFVIVDDSNWVPDDYLD